MADEETLNWDGRDANALLALDDEGGDFFRARVVQRNFAGMVFGGQLLAQSLAAATATAAPELKLHSCHGYYLAAGSPDGSIRYGVARLRDGRASMVRQATAYQGDVAIFTMLCSFARGRAGYAHQPVMPADVPPPEDCPDVVDYVRGKHDQLPSFTRQTYGTARPIERRLIDPDGFFFERPEAARRMFWLRMPGASHVQDAAAHRCLIAALSDAWLVGVAFAPHVNVATDPAVRLASIDHALWLHQDARAEEWLLYVTEGPATGRGRGLGLGSLFDRSGRLIASAGQEGVLIGAREPAPPVRR